MQSWHPGAGSLEHENPTLRHLHISLRITHKIATVLFGAVLLSFVLLTLLAWRLSQGPVDLNFLTGRLEAALNTNGAPTQIKIGGIALAWEGFNRGHDSPLDLRLHDIAIVDNTGRKRLEIPSALTTLAVPSLLIGRVVPRAVELDGMRLTLTRGADNTIGIDIGTLLESTDSPNPDTAGFVTDLSELMRPSDAESIPGHNVLSQLRRFRLHDLTLHVVDHALGSAWTASHIEFDLRRRSRGGVDVAGSAVVAMKDQHATLTLAAVSAPDLKTTLVRVSLGAMVPAALGLPGLDAVNAPVSVEATLTLSPTLAIQSGTAKLHVNAGTLRLGTGEMPIHSASLVVTGTHDALTLESASLVLPGLNGQADTTLSAAGTAQFGPLRLTATLDLGLDRVGFADLPRLWPTGVGGGARPWLTENITDGFAHDLHVALALEANNDFSDLTLTRATGTIEGEGMTVHWLRPVPPAEQARAHVRIVDTDTIDIAIAGGQQRIGTRTPIAITGGMLHMTGMAAKDQFADIAVQANGPFADFIALLKDPRLKLLSKHPIDLREPAGDATVSVKIKLPLENKVTMDDVGVSVTAHLRQGHLSAIAAGRDLDKAELDIAANKDQLTLKGTGLIGGIAATIDGSMNFQAGKPQDVTQRITVAGKASIRQLAATGLDLSDVVSGDVPLSAVWSQQRSGSGEIALDADLGGSTVSFRPLAWQKPAGTPLRASARLRLTGGRLSSIDSVVADGTNMTLRGSADMTAGHLTAVRLDRIVLGRNDLSGTVRMPPGGPIAVALSGASLDVAAKLAEKAPAHDRAKPDPPAGPAWTLTGHFGRVLLANNAIVLNVDATAANDGRIFSSLRVTGVTQPAGQFSADIGPGNGARRMTVTAADAGAFLRGLDVIRTMEGGTMSLSGTFNDTTAAHALTGTAELTDFRVRNAPALGRLLQSMTLYGLVDVVSGPGLAFARLTAPFVLADEDLELREARAFSPSLGMTAKGHINLRAETIDVQGTIVPAYFFNSMLGKIPFFGGLFRNEEGGGLFAANYSLKGPLADPSVSVNPLSMLTPGFLRQIFGDF